MSTLGSLRLRVPILDEEYFHEWKNEMLVIFNQYHLNKYIASPCAPHVDPMYPTLNESIDTIRNLRTVNLITRGLPRNLIGSLELILIKAIDVWRISSRSFKE